MLRSDGSEADGTWRLCGSGIKAIRADNANWLIIDHRRLTLAAWFGAASQIRDIGPRACAELLSLSFACLSWRARLQQAAAFARQ